MSFALSKILWFLFSPTSVIFVLLLVGLALQLSRWRRLGRKLVYLAAGVVVVLSALPIGHLMLVPLEERFAAPNPMPAEVAGIILLGGATANKITEHRGQPAVNGSAERILSFVELARHYPEARLMAGGASGNLVPGKLTEAEVTRMVLNQVGFDTSRIEFEETSRNTFENAKSTMSAINPKPEDTWLLVTSAAHMPRAMGAFRKAGWNVIAFPVDYRTENSSPWRWGGGLTKGLGTFRHASHEWLGLVVSHLLDRTSALFPKP